MTTSRKWKIFWTIVGGLAEGASAYVGARIARRAIEAKEKSDHKPCKTCGHCLCNVATRKTTALVACQDCFACLEAAAGGYEVSAGASCDVLGEREKKEKKQGRTVTGAIPLPDGKEKQP